MVHYHFITESKWPEYDFCSIQRVSFQISPRWQETFEKTEMAIKNGQSRENHNTGHRRHRTKTNTMKTQHRKLKRWATHTLPKTGCGSQMLTKGK